MFKSIRRNLALFVTKHQLTNQPINYLTSYFPFLKKQTQFMRLLSPKTLFCPNSNPIQSQFKANLMEKFIVIEQIRTFGVTRRTT